MGVKILGTAGGIEVRRDTETIEFKITKPFSTPLLWALVMSPP